MIDQHRRAKRTTTAARTRPDGLLAVGIGALLFGSAVALALSGRGGATEQPAATGAQAVADIADLTAAASPGTTPAAPDTTLAATTQPASATGTDAGTTTDGLQDLDGGETTRADACTMQDEAVRAGSSGDDVACVQEALAAAGFYSGPVNGQFDNATYSAVRALQEREDLFVDGVVGRETAIHLGVWPDEESFVVRTPAPAPGAMDLMGYPLSSVASAGSNAPPLPEDSGSGRRVVYDRRGQRVWAVGEDGSIIRSWLVSGSKYSNETPGTHYVYSRSERSTAWNGKAWLPQMIRYLRTDIGHIGFHAIPLHVDDNSPYQTEAELGQRLSGGCQRQANRDAAFMWDFAQVGTKVVVV